MNKLQNYSDEKFTTIIQKSTSFSDAARNLGIKPNSKNIPKIKLRAFSLNLPSSHFRPGKPVRHSYTDEQFIQAVKSNITVASVLREIGLVPSHVMPELPFTNFDLL